MSALLRLCFFAMLLVVSASALHADILVGTKREAVIAELGKPTSAARRGTHEILIYPKGVRLELEDDAVTDIKGYVPQGITLPASNAPIPSTLSGSSPPATTPPVTAEKTSPPSVLRPSRANTTPDENASAEINDNIPEAEPSLGFAIGIAAVMLAAQFLLTFTALKIAFHYHQMDALWSGILAITGLDVGLQTLFAIFFYFQTDEVRLGIAGTGLPGLAMIWSIRHFCLDQRWSRALATTSAVKLASILLNLALLALLARFG